MDEEVTKEESAITDIVEQDNNNWHHLEMQVAPPEPSSSSLFDTSLIEHDSKKYDDINIDSLIEQEAIAFINNDEQINNNSANTNATATSSSKDLFGKSFYDDINTSIYGENVGVLSQPFIGYVRRHEKKFSYEIGEYSILLRESKQLLMKIRKELDSLLKEKSGLDQEAYEQLNALNTYTMETMEWLFDIRKIYSRMETYYGPSMNPIGSISQIRMLTSYRKLLEEVNTIDNDKDSVLIRKNLEKIINVLQKRLEQFGGIKSTMRGINGSLDFDLPILDLSEQEKVLILVEFIDALQQDWAKERQKYEDGSVGLRNDFNELQIRNSTLMKENEALLAKNAELEAKLEKATHEKLLIEKDAIVPSELLEELQRVEVSVDASLKDLMRLNKVNRKSKADISNSLQFSDSISTKDVLDDTLSMSDASKLIVDDYTVNSTWTKEEFAESRRMSLHPDKSLKEIGLAASFQGSNVPFVKINLVPKLGGPWKKKQIIDRRKKGASILKIQNQSPAQPSLVVEASKNTTSFTPLQQDENPMIDPNEPADPVVCNEPAHIKEISLLTTKINKKITFLKRSTKMLNEFHDRISPQNSPLDGNDIEIADFFDPNGNLEASVAIVEEKINGDGLRQSFQSVGSDDDNSSTFSASNVKLPALSRSWSQNLKNKMN